MSVAIRCERIYDKEALKAIIQSCGCCPPEEPRCPPLDSSPCGRASNMNNGNCRSQMTSPSSYPSNNMTCPPQPPSPSSSPCPFICPPCTRYPCITCAPMPKPVLAPNDSTGSVTRTPMVSGGLFYIGTSRCYPPKPACCPKPCPDF